MNRIIVTGGAGFVGSNLAIGLKQRMETVEILAVDNLYRRGSELNLPRLRAAGVKFQHADVRMAEDLAALGACDWLIECSADPSVTSGAREPVSYLVDTNLRGAVNCAVHCRRHHAGLVFLSTSRVYEMAALRAARRNEGDTRFELLDEQRVPGLSAAGVAEDFPVMGPRSIYGATKLAAEVILADITAEAGIPLVVNRCGNLAGPWQFGTAAQGVLTFWLAAHRRKRPLRYIGFGGSGKQVRDFLHVADLIDLVDRQIASPEPYQYQPLNVGGGLANSVSLLELTHLCIQISGGETVVAPDPGERYGDIPVFITDSRRIQALGPWRPQRSLQDILADVDRWLDDLGDGLDAWL